MSVLTHGLRVTYSKHKCRCDPCVKAAQEYASNWYRKNAEHRKAKAAEWKAANKHAVRVIPDEKHGTATGYEYWRCRCDRCREANREAMRRYTGSKPRLAEDDIPHGTRTKYRRGCRCDGCREALREYARTEYRRRPEQIRARNRRWIAANRDRYQQWQARHYLADHEANKAKRRAYARANLAATLDRVALRKARLAAVAVERVSRAKVWQRDGGICYLCGKPADLKKWHLEHKIPIVLGGEHSYANVAVSHPVCNLRKGKRAYVGAAAGVRGSAPGHSRLR